jgi:hypothetical protein
MTVVLLTQDGPIFPHYNLKEEISAIYGLPNCRSETKAL